MPLNARSSIGQRVRALCNISVTAQNQVARARADPTVLPAFVANRDLTRVLPGEAESTATFWTRMPAKAKHLARKRRWDS